MIKKIETPYYECHVTVDKFHKFDEYIMQLVLNNDPDWKFSNITDDIVLGPGPKMYATANFPTEIGIKQCKENLAECVLKLKHLGLQVVRYKIECVVFDERLVA